MNHLLTWIRVWRCHRAEHWEITAIGIEGLDSHWRWISKYFKRVSIFSMLYLWFYCTLQLSFIKETISFLSSIFSLRMFPNKVLSYQYNITECMYWFLLPLVFPGLGIQFETSTIISTSKKSSCSPAILDSSW